MASDSSLTIRALHSRNSNHENALPPCLAPVMLGGDMLRRQRTSDRAMLLL
jgi:hypothetical protein